MTDKCELCDATTADALGMIESLIRQNCDCKGGVYHSGFIGIHAKAMDALVRAGFAEYVGDGYGRGRSIRFTTGDGLFPRRPHG